VRIKHADDVVTPARLDPALPQRQLRRAVDRIGDPRQRAMVDTFREHVYHEMISLDIDSLMATMAAEPALLFFGLPGMADCVGYAAVRNYYERSRDSRTSGLTVVFDRLVIDDETLVVEATTWCSGQFASAAYGVSLDLSRPVLLHKDLVIVIPFDNGLMSCERQYWNGAFTGDDAVYLDVASDGSAAG
jgi:hypothetical protein